MLTLSFCTAIGNYHCTRIPKNHSLSSRLTAFSHSRVFHTVQLTQSPTYSRRSCPRFPLSFNAVYYFPSMTVYCRVQTSTTLLTTCGNSSNTAVSLQITPRKVHPVQAGGPLVWAHHHPFQYSSCPRASQHFTKKGLPND